MNTSAEDLIKKRALSWWNHLSRFEQCSYEFKTYGYGNDSEDNTIIEADIIFMYKKYCNR